MKNITKVKIFKPDHEVFEAFVDPAQIGNFWFSSSSERWEEGKTVTLRYDEYDAQGDIQIIEVQADRKIVFRWGTHGEGNLVTITLKKLDNRMTVVEVSEDGFNDEHPQFTRDLLDNKEGWVYTLTCLKAYLEFGVNELRAGLVKD